MVMVLGGFSGELDDRLQLKDAIAFVPTDDDGLTAKGLRVRILDLNDAERVGKVTATVQSAPGVLERDTHPQFNDLWSLLRKPHLPRQIMTGEVKQSEVRLDACLPEMEHCPADRVSPRLPIEPHVRSVGFVVKLTMMFSDDFRPGMTVTGLVALDDEEPAPKK